mmetsp:Transcript_100749/g.240141  ORF Transcript_100749/g.240141 Transcript_100749/m.240141 type:complete len:322 (+) Transcript_100749:179-1144(+)
MHRLRRHGQSCHDVFGLLHRHHEGPLRRQGHADVLHLLQDALLQARHQQLGRVRRILQPQESTFRRELLDVIGFLFCHQQLQLRLSVHEPLWELGLQLGKALLDELHGGAGQPGVDEAQLQVLSGHVLSNGLFQLLHREVVVLLTHLGLLHQLGIEAVANLGLCHGNHLWQLRGVALHSAQHPLDGCGGCVHVGQVAAPGQRKLEAPQVPLQGADGHVRDLVDAGLGPEEVQSFLAAVQQLLGHGHHLLQALRLVHLHRAHDLLGPEAEPRLQRPREEHVHLLFHEEVAVGRLDGLLQRVQLRVFHGLVHHLVHLVHHAKP